MNNEITIKEAKNVDKKYGFTGETLDYNGHHLHRIVALKDLGDVNKGDIGGWVESEKNLSHEGNCWVDDDAKVWGNPNVALICGKAEVSDDVEVVGNTKV